MNGDTDFSLEAENNFILKAGKTSDIKITFIPKSTGLKTATLKVAYDEGQANLEIIGIAIEPISVYENCNIYFLGEIIPLPANHQINLQLNSYECTKASFSIININGKVMKTFNLNIDKGQNSIKIRTDDLLSGQYILQIKIHDLSLIHI